VLRYRKSRQVEGRHVRSYGTPPAAAQAAAADAGADLREARERLNLSLETIADHLRIRPSHLQAIEDGRLSSLPGRAYALAFVRTYAQALGLDAQEMVRRYKSDTVGCGRTELVFPTPMPQRGIPPGALILVGLVLTIAAYVGWYQLSGAGRLPAETVAAIPERLASLAEQRPRGADVAQAGTASSTQAGTASATTAATTGLQLVLADPQPGSAPTDPAPPIVFSPSSAAAAQLPFHRADETPVASSGETRVVLHANADAWVQVREPGGAVLLNRMLRAGESWPVPPRTDLLLTTGNAGGTTILVDGVSVPTLGGNGVVRRDLPLDPDQLKDGKLPPPVTTPLASPRTRL
jgi:cytoskeleton protein RodZ